MDLFEEFEKIKPNHEHGYSFCEVSCNSLYLVVEKHRNQLYKTSF